MQAIHPGLATAALVVSLVTVVGGAIAAPRLLVRLPADYFVRPAVAAPPGSQSTRQRVLLVLRSLLGVLLIALGAAMLVLPGQGVLMIVAGLSLMRFPGKRRLQRRLLGAPGIRAMCDAIRRRAGQPPLQL